MRCCGLCPQARPRASLLPPPPRRRTSFQHRLSQLLKKSSLPPLPPPPSASPSSSFASPPSPSPLHLLPPSPPRLRLRFLLRSPTPPRLQNFDGVDLHTLLLPASPSSPQTLKIDQLPPAESSVAPIRDAEQRFAGSLPPLVDAKSNSAFRDPSSDAKVASARKERSCGWAFVPDRAVLNVATRIAFLGATTGAALVGKVALAGATMTITVACSALQLISRAWDSSSGKVTPLPPPDQLPSVGICDSITSRSISISIVETVETSSGLSRTPPNQATNSSSSPRCLKRLEDKQEDRPLAPSISAHELDLVRAVGDRPPSSPLKSPPPTLLKQAARMGNSLEKQHSMNPLRDLHKQKAEHSDVDLSRAEQQQSYSLGFFLATIGLLIALSGLFAGRILGVLVVACWWYVIPSLRQTAGEKQTAVRVNLEEAGKAEQKGKKRNSSATLSSLERLPSDYRKRVIMEGILERDRRPTTG